MDKHSPSPGPSTYNHESGYVALLAVTILGLLSFGLAIVSQANILSSSGDITNNIRFQQAIELTQSCLEQARLQSILQPQYSGGDTVSINGSLCSILSFAKQGDIIEITTKAEFENSFAQLKTILDSHSLAIISQQLTN